MKNSNGKKLNAVIEIFKAIQWLYINDEEFKSVFENRLENYVNSLSEKEKRHFTLIIKNFK